MSATRAHFCRSGMLKLTSKAVGNPKGKQLPTFQMSNDLGQLTNLKLLRKVTTGSW
jgi:hypothetical protein